MSSASFGFVAKSQIFLVSQLSTFENQFFSSFYRLHSNLLMLQNFASKILFATLLAVFVLPSFSAMSKNISSTSNVVIQGNERVDNETILALLPHKSGKFSQKDSDEILRKLYESDLFFEVNISQEKNQLIIEVKENPLIAEVKFVGNKKIEDDALQSEISLKKRGLFTKAKLQSDLKRINELYLKSGRFLTKIDPKIIQKEQNRVEIIFEIFEGPKAKISNIYFVGNEHFSDQDLLDEVSTQKSKWWKFLSSSDVYDSDRIEFDKEKLRRFYGSKGYADFVAISSIAQINQDKNKFFITFLLEEGIKYKVGEITIENHIEKFDSSILQKEILIKSGKTYNSDLIDKTVDAMVKIMSDKSYAFAHIEPVLKRNKEHQIMDIVFVIQETPPIYINQIRITGNTRTLDEVIRRELRFREGDAYNITKINRSRQRLENLGFFEKVDFNTKRIGNSDKVDLEIAVKEKKTGELNLGVGYSTVNKLTANVGIKERNLMGTGQELGINVQNSFSGLTSELNYTKPYFMGRQIDVGFDLFQYNLSKRNTLMYSQKSSGITLRGDYSITEFLKHQIHYSFHQDKIGNVDSTASVNLQNLQGHFTHSMIGHTLLYDKRNNRINPSDGYYLSGTQDYTGIGGYINNIKYEGSAGYYLPTFTEDYVLKFLGRGGYIDGIGQDVRSNDSFFLGGNNFRGFQFAGLGPRSKSDGSVIGGKIYYVGTVEFKFPIGLPKELGISSALFSDNGTVKGVDQINKKGGAVYNSGSLRSAYGLSLIWSSPLGPIRLDFSKAAKKESYDLTQNFRFSFGTNF